jgi:hypothetical protein
MLKRILRATAALVFLSASTLAVADTQGIKAGDLTLSDMYARASVPGQSNGAAFLTIRNAGGTDRLLSATAGVSNVIELHTTVREGDTMRMRKVEQIDVTGGATTELKPGGLHIMLIGLTAPLVQGGRVPLTLRFERAGEVRVELDVQAAGARGAAHQH